MQMLGAVFILASLFALIFLNEDQEQDQEQKQERTSLGLAFRVFWSVVSLKQMKWVILFFLSYPVRVDFNIISMSTVSGFMCCFGVGERGGA